MGDALVMGRPHAWESGDKVFLTTPLTLVTPSAQQMEEYAFASAVKSMAPNEHIGWLDGKYVEANRGNRNGQMWLNDELAVKSMTPNLMPVTVMHDPRTAVGTIADCKLFDGAASSTSSRIDTILAIWRHRFGDVWEEAEENLQHGTLMQSMECLSPWYTCSDCGQQYVKLGEGREQASWCDHLREGTGRRILGDVCFTGTGLIFGTRGGRGAYTEAYLDHFQDEIAEFHQRAHIDGNYKPREENHRMGAVTIEQSELDALRTERNSARDELAAEQAKTRDLTTKAEQAEAATTKEKERADALETEKKGLEEKSQAIELKDKRWGALGSGFTAKLGEVTKTGLQESAQALSDEAWDARLKEVEELTGVKRDAAESADDKEGSGAASGSASGSEQADAGTSFKDEELASFVSKGVTAPASAPAPGGNAARSLAKSFAKSRQPVKAGKE